MKISLINMPFAPLGAPSIGLTQIESVVKRQFGTQVDVQSYYLNLDFAAQIKDSGFYNMAVSSYARISGLSDWFFRSAAFPDAEDNIDEYLARYYYDDTSESVSVVDFIRHRRRESYKFLDELIEKYELASSDIAGFSLCFFQTTASIAMANRLKVLNPDMTIVFGGPAVKGVQGRTLVDNVPSVDYVFSGPGLVSFPEMVSCLLTGDDDSISKIQGVFSSGVSRCVLRTNGIEHRAWSMEKRGHTHRQASSLCPLPAAPCGDKISRKNNMFLTTKMLVDARQVGLADLPPERVVGANIDINADIELDYEPFLDKFDECIDDPALFPYLLMQTSRGCWWADRQRCTFCGLNCLSEHFEAMSPQNAIRHIRSVLKYSDRVSHFVACDNVVPPNYFKEVFPYLDTPENAFIKYETRSNITAAEIKTLYEAGIRCVQPGVEALSTESLKLMRKGLSAFSNIRFLKDCLRYHIFAEWNILLFSPGESDEVYRKYEMDIPRLAHLQPPVDVFPIEFVRDSCYFEAAQEFGIKLEPQESLAYIYPFDKETITGLCFRFSDRNADKEKINYWLEHLGGMVGEWRERWSVESERRPQLILWRDDHSAVIYDSRFGEGESYRISDTAESLLKVMDTPITAEDAAHRIWIGESSARNEIEILKERNLLFEEDGRYLSLVIAEV